MVNWRNSLLCFWEAGGRDLMNFISSLDPDKIETSLERRLLRHRKPIETNTDHLKCVLHLCLIKACGGKNAEKYLLITVVYCTFFLLLFIIRFIIWSNARFFFLITYNIHFLITYKKFYQLSKTIACTYIAKLIISSLILCRSSLWIFLMSAS